MKIAFNRRIVDGPYGGGNQVLRMLSAYFSGKGHDVVFDLSNDVDVIVLMDVRDRSVTFSLEEVEEQRKKGAKVIHRINENDAHRPNSKGLDDLIIQSNKRVADKTVFVSEWLRGYFIDKGMNVSNSVVIRNGSDRTLFYREDRSRRPMSPLKIVTHHFSDNIYKGYPIYKELDRFCNRNPQIAQFTFIGRPMKGSLQYCRKISAQPYHALPELLREHDVYVSASLFEPGPNHIPEGLSCGLIPLIHSEADACIEYAKDFVRTFKDAEELFEIIRVLQSDYIHYKICQNRMAFYDYGKEDMCKQYEEII